MAFFTNLVSRNGQHDVPGHEPYGASIPFKKRMRIEI